MKQRLKDFLLSSLAIIVMSISAIIIIISAILLFIIIGTRQLSLNFLDFIERKLS